MLAFRYAPQTPTGYNCRFARTNLELFVLAAVRAGLDSAYDLNKGADLSVGATLPLLSRLGESRFAAQ